jgi:hypothetical protein
MEMGVITLSEISQTQNNKYGGTCILLYVESRFKREMEGSRRITWEEEEDQ